MRAVECAYAEMDDADAARVAVISRAGDAVQEARQSAQQKAS